MEVVKGADRVWIFGGTKNPFTTQSNSMDVYAFNPSTNTMSYIPALAASVTSDLPPAGWGLAVAYYYQLFYAFGIFLSSIL